MSLAPRSPFALDLRSLAFFRIGMALLLLGDLGLRAIDLEAHYTDQGVSPIAKLGAHALAWIGVHRLDGSLAFQGLLFCVHALLGLALLFGVRTRVATWLCWAMALSLQSRNPWLSSGGDTLLRQLLLIGAFCPLGARYSIDALLHGAPAETAHKSIATVMLMVQVALVMLLTGVTKCSSPDWTSTGMATYYATHSRHTGLGSLLFLLPADAFRVLSFATLGIELAVPVLLFSPLGTERLRRVLLPVAMLLLWGVGLTLSVGILPFLEAVGLLVFMPGSVWTQLAGGLSRSALRERIERAQHAFRDSRLLRALSVAPRLRIGKLSVVLCALLLIDIAGYSLESIPNRPLPSAVLLRPLAVRLGINQWWPMFSAPNHFTQWVLVAGSVGGEQIALNALADDTATSDDPRERSHSALGYRWLKLFETLLESRDAEALQRVASVLCTSWKAETSASAREVTLFAATQAVEADYRYGPVALERLVTVQCAR